MNWSKINLEARREIATTCREYGWTYCMLHLPGCTGSANDPAHRHKRIYYKHNPKLLYDVRQWLPACRNCHNIIEKDRNLTQLLFNLLRGEE